MSMHKGMLGRTGVDGPGSADLTLGDYITRKQRQDAFDQVAQEKKLTFGQWYNETRYKWNFDNDVPSYVDDVIDELLRECWRIAQENK